MRLPVLSSDAVRAAERLHPRELADGTLMQRAAFAVATECLAVLRESGHVVGRHVLLLVGGGDNGGDALFAGALLARRGAAVFAVPVSTRMHAAGAAALRAAGGRVIDVPAALELFSRLDLVIDGIVGLGSTRGLDGDAALLARAVDDAKLYTVAVDIPSGVHADSGAVQGVAVRADVTVTFGALRRAHVVPPAALLCGEVMVADIGVPMDSVNVAVTAEGLWFSAPPADADKYARGVLGVVTGSRTYPGAALLSTGAALRSGCGMVRFFGEARDAVVQAHPEVVASGLADIATARCQAWLVGCGLGTDDRAAEALQVVLQRPEPVVVDADAISLLAHRADMRTIMQERADGGRITLFTPHAGEAQRLAQALGLPIDLDFDRLGAAHSLATALGSPVLLKGPSTIVTDGRRFVATPLLGSQLATAGSGDVLAGLIAGAAARWSAAGDFRTDDLMELAAAAALRHAAAALPADTTASDLVVGLDRMPSTTMTS